MNLAERGFVDFRIALVEAPAALGRTERRSAIAREVLGAGKNRERVISGIKRVSKPGRRVYAKKESLPKVLGGLGTAIISTSRGLVTSAEARKLGLGGEVICFIW